MKHYIRQIKPYIEPPCLQGFNNTPIPVEGYDWVSEDLEEELRKNIVVKDPWSTLIFKERFIEENKTCDGCVRVGEGSDISGSTCYLCQRNPVDHRIDWFEECSDINDTAGLINYVENVMHIELLPYQKRFLKFICENYKPGEPLRIVYPKGTNPFYLNGLRTLAVTYLNNLEKEKVND